MRPCFSRLSVSHSRRSSEIQLSGAYNPGTDYNTPGQTGRATHAGRSKNRASSAERIVASTNVSRHSIINPLVQKPIFFSPSIVCRDFSLSSREPSDRPTIVDREAYLKTTAELINVRFVLRFFVWTFVDFMKAWVFFHAAFACADPWHEFFMVFPCIADLNCFSPEYSVGAASKHRRPSCNSRVC